MFYWHLTTPNWLDTLPEDTLQYLQSASKIKEYERGEMIFKPEAQPSYVYLLKSGRIRIFRHSSQGGEFTFSYAEPGFIFGELSILEDVERRNFAEAVERSTVIKIPKQNFLHCMRNSIQFSNIISLQLAKRLSNAKINIEDLVFKDAKSRIACKLLELDSHPAMKVTHADIAKMTGVSRPTTSIVIGEFEDDELISRERGIFVLLDKIQLTEISTRDIR